MSRLTDNMCKRLAIQNGCVVNHTGSLIVIPLLTTSKERSNLPLLGVLLLIEKAVVVGFVNASLLSDQ
jgi:hypothetical protein